MERAANVIRQKKSQPQFARPIALRRITPLEAIRISISISERERKLPPHGDPILHQFELRFSLLRAFPREVVAQMGSNVALQLSCPSLLITPSIFQSGTAGRSYAGPGGDATWTRTCGNCPVAGAYRDRAVSQRNSLVKLNVAAAGGKRGNGHDRAQKAFASNGFAIHTPSFRLSRTLFCGVAERTSCCSNNQGAGNSDRHSKFALTVRVDGLSVAGRGLLMWACSSLVVPSIAILIAYAFDAFRSG
jgi:hypothetical protein